jgi:hypothetical protein
MFPNGKGDVVFIGSAGYPKETLIEIVLVNRDLLVFRNGSGPQAQKRTSQPNPARSNDLAGGGLRGWEYSQ